MPKPIPKADLVSDYAEKSKMTKAQAGAAIDMLIQVLTDRIAKGDTVALPGLAKFEVVNRPARQVRNVATGQMIDKPADRAVKVSALSGIKAAVNL